MIEDIRQRMVNLFKRLPVLCWLSKRATHACKELATSHHALERRVERLDASLRFLISTLHSAADGAIAIHFASGAEYTNLRGTRMWGHAPEAVKAPRSKCKKQRHTKLWTTWKPPSTHLILSARCSFAKPLSNSSSSPSSTKSPRPTRNFDCPPHPSLSMKPPA